MPLVLYESRDSVENIYAIWSGASPIITANAKLYSDILDIYLVGLHSQWNNFVTKISTNDGLYTALDIDPPADQGHLEMTHYLGEMGLALYSVVIEGTGDRELFGNTYPELGIWVTLPGNLPQDSIDIVFPDMIDSPRFVVGFDGNTVEKVYVILATDPELSMRYATNWTAMAPEASITDLEVVRFI